MLDKNNYPDEEGRETDHYHRLRPEDFDFSMSDTFRGHSFQYCGMVDPYPETIKPAEELPSGDYTITHVHIHHHIAPEREKKKGYNTYD